MKECAHDKTVVWPRVGLPARVCFKCGTSEPMTQEEADAAKAEIYAQAGVTEGK